MHIRCGYMQHVYMKAPHAYGYVFIGDTVYYHAYIPRKDENTNSDVKHVMYVAMHTRVTRRFNGIHYISTLILCTVNLLL